MKKVTKEEFYREISRFNCHPKQVGSYPYLSRFQTPGGLIIGEERPIGKWTVQGNPVYPIEYEYFIR